MNRIFTLAPVLLLLSGTAASAGTDDAKRPPLLQKLVDCRAVADLAQRLACYDSNVAALDSAEAKHDIAVVSRSDVQESRKALFGFRLPSLAIFGHGDPKEHGEEDELKEVTAQVAGVGDGPDGYVISMVGGAVWRQTDGNTFGRRPRAGDTAKFTRGTLGSYWIHVNGGAGYKVVRVQ